MTIAELIVLNKERYTKVFIVENEKKSNQAIFRKIDEESITEYEIKTEAVDYFMLDKQGIDEIFGNSKELKITEEDMVLLIGL